MRSLSLVILLAVVVAASGHASAEPLASRLTAPPLTRPALSLTGSCEPIDFDSVDIQWYAGRGVYLFTVSGIKPYTNMEVSLSHQGYQSLPAFWRTLVIGCVKNFLVMPIPSRDHAARPVRGQPGHRDCGCLAQPPPHRAAAQIASAIFSGREGRGLVTHGPARL
jgi:hypothetical protein